MKKKQMTSHTCGECARGEWSTKHINQRTTQAGGGPFLKECEFATFAQNAQGMCVCLYDTPACDKFIAVCQS